jgi:magnesium chelatase family protein
MVARYQGRISGPLLDRIDVQVEVGMLSHEELLAPGCGETSQVVAQRVSRAARRQLERQGKPNAALSSAEVDRYCLLDKSASALLNNAMARLGWSARAYHRVLKVARTIADLADVESIGEREVAEAVHYRRSLGKP